MDHSWKSPTDALTSKAPPLVVKIPHHFDVLEDDDVSLLQDDPDEDDAQLLPQSTYNVLLPLMDELYSDESSVDEKKK